MQLEAGKIPEVVKPNAQSVQGSTAMAAVTFFEKVPDGHIAQSEPPKPASQPVKHEFSSTFSSDSSSCVNPVGQSVQIDADARENVPVGQEPHIPVPLLKNPGLQFCAEISPEKLKKLKYFIIFD